jgi:hypothetical protein
MPTILIEGLNRIMKIAEVNRARLLEAWDAYFAGRG